MDFLFLPIIQNIKVEENPVNNEQPVQEEQKVNTAVNLVEKQQPEPEQILNMVVENRNTKYVKKFIEKNKNMINSKIECPICYSTYTYFNKAKHYKTKRHLKMLERNL